MSQCIIHPCVAFASIKLGVIEDTSNRTRLAKLLRFYSSHSDTEQTSLAEYMERMKEKQEAIYFIAGTSRAEVSIINNMYIYIRYSSFVSMG